VDTTAGFSVEGWRAGLLVVAGLSARVGKMPTARVFTFSRATFRAETTVPGIAAVVLRDIKKRLSHREIPLFLPVLRVLELFCASPHAAM
jgi:hypothetical protein